MILKRDLVLHVLRFFAQWSTLILSVILRDQFSAGIILRGLGGLMMVLGITLWVVSRAALGQAFTSSPSPKGFVTTGIYSKLRHPMYIGGLLLFLGCALLFQSIIGLALTGLLILPLLVYSAAEEEKQMLEKFGEEYLDYRKHRAF